MENREEQIEWEALVAQTLWEDRVIQVSDDQIVQDEVA